MRVAATIEEHRAAAARLVLTPAERRAASSFFGGRESTRAQRDELRAALAACPDAGLVEALRLYFNTAAASAEIIAAYEVTAALRALRAAC